MKITLSPTRMDATLTAVVDGDVLILNGETLDFSAVTGAAPLERHGHFWIMGPVRREEGELHLTLLLPHGARPPPETLFPQPVRLVSGPVPLPPFDSPESGQDPG